MLRVGGEKSFENYCIELSGGRNMAAGLGVDRAVNIEQILEWNPDIIFIGGWRKNTNPIDIYQNQMLTEVSAIKNKRVFKMPVWSSNQSVLTWKWMAEILHPKLFNYKMREEVRQWYAWEYHFKLSDSEINKFCFALKMLFHLNITIYHFDNDPKKAKHNTFFFADTLDSFDCCSNVIGTLYHFYSKIIQCHFG